MRRVVWLIPLLLATVVAGPFAATAQEPAAAPAGTPALEALLPADTFLVASVPDVPAMHDQMSRTALGKLWREPEVQRFLRPAMEMLEAKLAKAEKKSGHRLADVLDMFRGQIGLAVVEFDPMFGGLIPDAVMYVDFGERRADAEKLIGEMMAKARNMAVRTSEYEGHEIRHVTMPNGMEVAASWFGNAMALSARADRLEHMYDAWKAGAEGSLQSNPTYGAAMERVGGADSFLNAFVNVEAILGHFGQRVDPSMMHVLDVTGLSGMKSISMASSMAGEGIRDSFFVAVPGEKRGLMKLAYTAPDAGTGLLDRVPADAFYATAGAGDLNEMVSILMDLARNFDPSAVDQIEMGLAQAKQMLGVDIRDDLLAPLGQEMGAYMTLPAGGGLIPDVVFLAKLDDPARFQNALTQIVARVKMMMEENEKRLSLEHRTMDFMGKTIHYVHVSHRRGDPVPVTPSFLVDGDLLAVALFPQPLKDMIARAGNAPSIRQRPDFQRVMKGLPDGMKSVEYMDLGVGFRWLYGTAVPVLQAIGKHRKCPVDFALLPRTEVVAKHLFGAAWGVKTTDAGLEFHAYSQVGIVPMAIGVMVPVMFLARQKQMEYEWHEAPSHGVEPPEETAPMPEPVEPPVAPGAAVDPRVSLKEIYIALLYQYAEKSAYPENLGQLVESRALENADTLLLPGDEQPLSTGGGHKTSFAYVGPKVGSLREHTDQAVWVYERDGLGDGARWVLFADGSVRQVPADQFAKLLAGTRQMLAK